MSDELYVARKRRKIRNLKERIIIKQERKTHHKDDAKHWKERYRKLKRTYVDLLAGLISKCPDDVEIRKAWNEINIKF